MAVISSAVASSALRDQELTGSRHRAWDAMGRRGGSSSGSLSRQAIAQSVLLALCRANKKVEGGLGSTILGQPAGAAGGEQP